MKLIFSNLMKIQSLLVLGFVWSATSMASPSMPKIYLQVLHQAQIRNPALARLMTAEMQMPAQTDWIRHLNEIAEMGQGAMTCEQWYDHGESVPVPAFFSVPVNDPQSPLLKDWGQVDGLFEGVEAVNQILAMENPDVYALDKALLGISKESMRSKCACPASFFRSVESVSERIIDELWKDSPFTHTVSEWRRFGQGIGELDAISSAGCPVTLRAKWNQLLAKAKIVAKNGLTLAIPDPVPAPPISQTAWLQSGVYTSGVSPMSSFKIENLVDGTMIASGTIAYQNGDFPWQGVVVLEGDDGNGTYSYSVTGSLIFETSGRYTRGSCAAPVALKMVSTAHGVRVSLYSPNRGPVPGVNYGPYCDLPSSWITIAEPFRFKN